MKKNNLNTSQKKTIAVLKLLNDVMKNNFVKCKKCGHSEILFSLGGDEQNSRDTWKCYLCCQ